VRITPNAHSHITHNITKNKAENQPTQCS